MKAAVAGALLSLAGTVCLLGCGGSSSSPDCDVVSDPGYPQMTFRALPGEGPFGGHAQQASVEILCGRLHTLGATAEMTGDGPRGIWAQIGEKPKGVEPSSVFLHVGDFRAYDLGAVSIGRADGYPSAFEAAHVAARQSARRCPKCMAHHPLYAHFDFGFGEGPPVFQGFSPTATERARNGHRVGLNPTAIEIPVGTTMIEGEPKGGRTAFEDRWYVIRDEPVLTNADIESATAGSDPHGRPAVTVELADGGSGRLGGRLALTLDDSLLGTAAIGPHGESLVIPGPYGSMHATETLAAFLDQPPLPVQLEMVRGPGGE